MAPIDELDLRFKVAEMLGHWPCAGLAVAIVRDGLPDWFFGHSVADVDSRAPSTEDTVSWIGLPRNTCEHALAGHTGARGEDDERVGHVVAALR